MSIQSNVTRTVRFLSEGIGSRDYLRPEALESTVEYISSAFMSYGYAVSYQNLDLKGRIYRNVSVEIRGREAPEEVLVVGAHYDTFVGIPGADDNASGVSALLELARILRDRPLARTVQFVAFTLEEPPFFGTEQMGSYRYARMLKKEDRNIKGMICLESIGYFTDTPGSQFYPLPFLRLRFHDKGNFIAFVSNLSSRGFLSRTKRAFRKGSALSVASLYTPSIIPGIDLSDHRSFWAFGYPAIMVTDTAFFRNPHYHGAGDMPDTIDYERLSEVVIGLTATIEALA